MRLPYTWGFPTAAPDVYGIGGSGWFITWSPRQVHPYAAHWVRLGATFGPGPQTAPPMELWFYSLRVK